MSYFNTSLYSEAEDLPELPLPNNNIPSDSLPLNVNDINNTSQKEDKMVWLGPIAAVSVLFLLGAVIIYSVKKEEYFNLIGGSK